MADFGKAFSALKALGAGKVEEGVISSLQESIEKNGLTPKTLSDLGKICSALGINPFSPEDGLSQLTSPSVGAENREALIAYLKNPSAADGATLSEDKQQTAYKALKPFYGHVVLTEHDSKKMEPYLKYDLAHLFKTENNTLSSQEALFTGYLAHQLKMNSELDSALNGTLNPSKLIKNKPFLQELKDKYSEKISLSENDLANEIPVLLETIDANKDNAPQLVYLIKKFNYEDYSTEGFDPKYLEVPHYDRLKMPPQLNPFYEKIDNLIEHFRNPDSVTIKSFNDPEKKLYQSLSLYITQYIEKKCLALGIHSEEVLTSLDKHVSGTEDLNPAKNDPIIDPEDPETEFDLKIHGEDPLNIRGDYDDVGHGHDTVFTDLEGNIIEISKKKDGTLESDISDLKTDLDDINAETNPEIEIISEGDSFPAIDPKAVINKPYENTLEKTTKETPPQAQPEKIKTQKEKPEVTIDSISIPKEAIKESKLDMKAVNDYLNFNISSAEEFQKTAVILSQVLKGLKKYSTVLGDNKGLLQEDSNSLNEKKAEIDDAFKKISHAANFKLPIKELDLTEKDKEWANFVLNNADSFKFNQEKELKSLQKNIKKSFNQKSMNPFQKMASYITMSNMESLKPEKRLEIKNNLSNKNIYLTLSNDEAVAALKMETKPGTLLKDWLDKKSESFKSIASIVKADFSPEKFSKFIAKLAPKINHERDKQLFIERLNSIDAMAKKSDSIKGKADPDSTKKLTKEFKEFYGKIVALHELTNERKKNQEKSLEEPEKKQDLKPEDQEQDPPEL